MASGDNLPPAALLEDILARFILSGGDKNLE